MAPILQPDVTIIKKTFTKSLKMSVKSTNVGNEFESSEKIILDYESNLGKNRKVFHLWEDSIDDAKKYLSAVDTIVQLIEDKVLEKDGEFADRVNNVLQTAMSRLEEEFRHILIRNVVPLDGDRICGSIRRISLSSFASDDFETAVDDDHDSDSLCDERRSSMGDELCLDLITPDAVFDLKEIAVRMVRAGYEKECCQVYSTIRRDALYECLSLLGVEKISIEDVQKLEWGSLDEKMKKWIQAVKTVTRFLLFAEKQLCDQVFCSSERIRGVCFIETAKECLMQLLNFGEAVVVVQQSPEKVFRILDMYDALENLRLDLKALFADDSGDIVLTEAEGVLAGLGETAKGTFAEFENAVKNEASRMVTHGGEVHPLARYVMNYIKLLIDYSDSLNVLLEDGTGSSSRPEIDDGASSQQEGVTPIGRRLLPLISSLEANLENKAKLYEDGALRYIFLMNNILYIVQKVKDSELGKHLGDRWVRRRRSQVRQYATCYLRASWSKVLSFLRDEGLFGGGNLSNVSKVALKERFKNFNTAFEDIYKSQSAWKVPDAQLRDELKISISERVIPAYRSFMGRFRTHLDSGRHVNKYVKYSPEDIENHLVDLFEGTPRDLHHPKRKGST